MSSRRIKITGAVLAVAVCSAGVWAYSGSRLVHSKPTPQGHVVKIAQDPVSGPPSPDRQAESFAIGTNLTLPGERAPLGTPWNPGPPPADVAARLAGHGEFIPDQAAFAKKAEELGTTVLMGAWSTNFYHAIPSQADNIALAAKKMHGQVVQPGQTFSYNDTVGPFSQEQGFGWGRMFVGTRIVPSIGGGVCQGASTLYNAVVLANLKVVTRTQHGLTVPYLPPGQDATVTSSGGIDFQFRNNTSGPVMIFAQARGLWLTVRIYGTVKPPQVTWHHEELSRMKFTTIYQNDPTLKKGEQKVLAPGQDGVTVKTWLTIVGPEGEKRVDLGIDRYNASPRIIAVGTKTT